MFLISFIVTAEELTWQLNTDRRKLVQSLVSSHLCFSVTAVQFGFLHFVTVLFKKKLLWCFRSNNKFLSLVVKKFNCYKRKTSRKEVELRREADCVYYMYNTVYDTVSICFMSLDSVRCERESRFLQVDVGVQNVLLR